MMPLANGTLLAGIQMNNLFQNLSEGQSMLRIFPDTGAQAMSLFDTAAWRTI